MKFCSECGSGRLEWRVPAGDDRSRHVCPDCRTIHYANPKVVAGMLVECDGRLLLCRRAIEPRYGLWTLPAGFMENHEGTEQAALRETWEECRARPSLQRLYTVLSIPHVNQVYMMFLGRLDRPEFGPGPESLEVALVEPEAIPWERLAFTVVARTLKHYLADRASGDYGLHVGDIVKPAAAR